MEFSAPLRPSSCLASLPHARKRRNGLHCLLCQARRFTRLTQPKCKQEALARLRVIVAPTGTWKDSAGQTVGGQTYFTIIQVDQGLTSLCHEVAHVLEFAIDGAVDALHSRWEARGIHAADEDYRLKLLGA